MALNLYLIISQSEFFDSSAGIEVLQSEVVILGGLSWNALENGAKTSRFYDELNILFRCVTVVDIQII